MRRLLFAALSVLILAGGCITLAGTPAATGTPPVVNSFSASPASIQPGAASTLSWTVSGAATVTIDNGIGSVALSGTRAVAPAASTVYVLTASGPTGSVTATTQVLVPGAGAPSVAGPTNAPVITTFSAIPGEIMAGYQAVLSWNVSNAASISIDQGIGNVPASGSMTITPGATTVFTLTATNSSGSVTAGAQVAVASATPPSPPAGPLSPIPPLHLPPFTLITTVYDFVAQAPTASWMSSVNLAFPGTDTDNRGFALLRNNATLEDNNVYTQVLETHPQWVTGGTIEGAYVGMAGTYKVQAGDHFYSRVGFLKGANAGNVKFRVMIRTGSGNYWIGDVAKAYSGGLTTIDIPLSAYEGTKPDFILKVDANNTNATQDWAVWVNAKITR